MRRRDFIRVAPVVGAGALLPGCGRASRGDGPRPRTVRPASSTTGTLPTPEAMARELLDTPRDDVPALALGWHARGATPDDLLRVGLLAGVAEIDPSPIGGKVHAIMMVSSALDVTARLEGPAALLPALFDLDRVKDSQARDERDGDFVMPPAPEVEPAPAAEHAEALDRAMLRWDAVAADRAVIGLQATLEPAALFERLWPWGARDFRVIGHKAIYAAQIERALARLGWSYGRDALRSLALGMLDANPYDAASEAETAEILGLYDSGRELAATLPEGWERGRAEPEASFRLCARLRDCDPRQAADAVAVAVRAGVGAAGAWDGLRLRAFELLMHTPTIPGVHPVTMVNALRHAASSSTVASTRALALVQAASWLSLFVPLLGGSDRPGSPSIESLTAATGRAGGGDPFAVDDPVEAGRRAFTMVQERGTAMFGAEGLSVLVRKATEDHDYKLVAAVLDELEQAHPHCRPHLASASLRYWPRATDDDGSVYEAVREPLGLP